jgi:hypothetical protein
LVIAFSLEPVLAKWIPVRRLKFFIEQESFEAQSDTKPDSTFVECAPTSVSQHVIPDRYAGA